MKLSELKKGEKGIIESINANPSMMQKFLSMGLTPGEEVIIEKIAPLGSPIDLIVKNYHLSLRKEEAEMIDIRRIQ